MDLFYISNGNRQSYSKKHPLQSNTSTPSSSFSELVQSKDKAVADSYSTSTTNLSADEYKQYIYDKISNMSVNPLKTNWEMYLSISDEGFEAMQQDPAYEQWVLGKIQSSLLSPNSSGQEVFECMSFGATKNEFRHESISTPTASQKKKMREQYLRDKEERQKELKKLQEKKRLEAKWQKEVYNREYVKLQQLDHTLEIQKENEALRFQEDFNYQDHSSALQSAAKRKAAAYTSTFLYTGLNQK